MVVPTCILVVYITAVTAELDLDEARFPLQIDAYIPTYRYCTVVPVLHRIDAAFLASDAHIDRHCDGRKFRCCSIERLEAAITCLWLCHSWDITSLCSAVRIRLLGL